MCKPLSDLELSVSLNSFAYIDEENGWKRCVEALRRETRFAIDLEANSLYAYREQVCLIQISTSTQDFIVDPLAGFDFSELGELLADERVEKVFHASEYDLILLMREFGWGIKNLFDTMWAARLLGYNNMGLAWFLGEFYGVTVSKKHQKANWMKRPLPEDQLAYAQMDTHYLLRLRDDLAAQIEERGLTQESHEIFVRETEVRVPDRSFDPESFWSLRGARELSKRGLAILRELNILRDNEARQRDLPPFKIMSTDMLCRIAEKAPRNMHELRAIPGLPPRMLDRLGPRILRGVELGRSAPIPQPPARRPRTDAAVLDRYERLFQWRKLHAQDRGVESDVVLTRESMWAIARTNPKSIEELADAGSLGPSRLALYGELILEALHSPMPMTASEDVSRPA